MNQTEQSERFYEVFSPTIMETSVPIEFVNIINRVGDGVLNDDTKSMEWDFSSNLVGKVHKEVQIPISKDEEAIYCMGIMKDACATYLKKMVELNRAYDWVKQKGTTIARENINIAQSWIVSQYKGEYNPWHKHSGNFSAVIYLKIPDKMQEEYDEDKKDHYPANGLIEFMFGESQEFRSDNIKFRPQVGKMLIFPSWLKHSVYPFHVDGERRSMSFNAYYTVSKK